MILVLGEGARQEFSGFLILPLSFGVNCDNNKKFQKDLNNKSPHEEFTWVFSHFWQPNTALSDICPPTAFLLRLTEGF